MSVWHGYSNVLSGMKAKTTLAGGFCSIGRFYFFFLDFFFFLHLCCLEARGEGMDPSLCMGETPAPGSLHTPGLELQGGNLCLGTSLLTDLRSKPSGQAAFIFMVSQTDAYELSGVKSPSPQPAVKVCALSHGGEARRMEPCCEKAAARHAIRSFTTSSDAGAEGCVFSCIATRFMWTFSSWCWSESREGRRSW